MANGSTKYNGERLSFFKLFSKKGYKLVVPIIQRDYAQGRTSEDTTEVRNEFLDALYKYLEEGKPNRDLDFVYGTLRKSKSLNGEETACLIPLDGQQRLTTLFLLHWYLVQISTDTELSTIFNSALIKNGKSMFSYETRQSSADFCDELIQCSIDFDHLKTVKDDNNIERESLSATIQNQQWFYRNWMNDPTIVSMLVMLDAIHTKFGNHAEFLPLLLDNDNPVITFIFLDLDEYRLTDDLYIKMNSRGLPLSKFENLKAKLEQHLDSFDAAKPPLKDRKFTLLLSAHNQDVSMKKYFSHNIDTKWTTLFWQYAKESPREIDSYIENFIRIVITNEYARMVSLGNQNKSDATLDLLYDSKNKSITYSKYESSGALTADAMLAVIDAMDALYNGDAPIAHYICDEYRFYFDEDKIFKKVINNDLSRPERIQFYAYIQYLIRYSDQLTGINEWMRVIYNLSNPDNTVTDSNYELSNGLKEIDKLLEHAPQILAYLRTNPSIGRFSGHQVYEEIIKSYLVDMPNWRTHILTAEKHNYFVGQIGFMLSFAGIVDEFKTNTSSIITNGRFTWSVEDEGKTLDKFVNYVRIASYLFQLTNGERQNDVNYCFERAVLTKGDYLLNWGSSEWWNILSTETVKKNVKRDYSWRRLLRIVETSKTADPDIIASQQYIKEIFDYIGNQQNITEKLEELCKQYDEGFSWRYCLINCSQIIRYSSKGWLHFSDQNDTILVLKEWYLNMYHVELFTYYLWLTEFEQHTDAFSGKDAFYCPQKNSETLPTIRINGFKHNHRKYYIEISANVADDDFKSYRIAFRDNNISKFDYPQEIMDTLDSLKFRKSSDPENNSLVCNLKSPKSVFERVKDLCSLL